MTAYYNEFDPFAAAWLRELIKAGHIAHGVVDERSIEDVTPNELIGYTQCHFFAGIGGWSLALRHVQNAGRKNNWQNMGLRKMQREIFMIEIRCDKCKKVTALLAENSQMADGTVLLCKYCKPKPVSDTKNDIPDFLSGLMKGKR